MTAIEGVLSKADLRRTLGRFLAGFSEEAKRSFATH
jgi:hypothetical protein